MRIVAAVSLVAVAATGSLSPALAGPKPKPITKKYTAEATPDPTTTLPGGEVCDPVTPRAKHSTAFKVPAAGTLTVELDNKLDWAIGIRSGGKLLGSADGTELDTKEVAQVKFKRPAVVSIDVCNWAGEPTVPVKVTFTYA